jgi:hypothetical protein
MESMCDCCDDASQSLNINDAQSMHNRVAIDADSLLIAAESFYNQLLPLRYRCATAPESMCDCCDNASLIA